MISRNLRADFDKFNQTKELNIYISRDLVLNYIKELICTQSSFDELLDFLRECHLLLGCMNGDGVIIGDLDIDLYKLYSRIDDWLEQNSGVCELAQKSKKQPIISVDTNKDFTSDYVATQINKIELSNGQYIAFYRDNYNHPFSIVYNKDGSIKSVGH